MLPWNGSRLLLFALSWQAFDFFTQSNICWKLWDVSGKYLTFLFFFLIIITGKALQEVLILACKV